MKTRQLTKSLIVDILFVGAAVIAATIVLTYQLAYKDAQVRYKLNYDKIYKAGLWEGREENYNSITTFMYENEIGQCIRKIKENE